MLQPWIIENRLQWLFTNYIFDTLLVYLIADTDRLRINIILPFEKHLLLGVKTLFGILRYRGAFSDKSSTKLIHEILQVSEKSNICLHTSKNYQSLLHHFRTKLYYLLIISGYYRPC